MAKKPMNVIMIMADQQHKYALGSVSPFVKTPNLDRLAANGTLFTQAYSANPVCGPFRAVLFAGTYTKDNGVLTNGYAMQPGELCLAHEMNDLGFETSFVGKIHLGATGNAPVARENQAGHKHFMGYQCYNEYHDNVYFYDENGGEHKFDYHRTNVTADMAIEQLREFAKEGKPFLQTVFFQSPHYPEQPDPEFEHLYDGVEIPLAEEYSPIEPYTETWSPLSPRPCTEDPVYQRYGGNMQLFLKLYYAMVSQIDYNVGKILDELDRLGLADNTAIIYSADHGDMQGSHGLKAKSYPHERSCGIPLIMYIPGVKQNPVCDVPVCAVDYYPTCMDLAGGFKPRKHLPGVSLVDLATKPGCKEHPDVFAENLDRELTWIMLRNKQYKLVLNRKNYDRVSLYDMLADPTEAHNLIDDPAYAQVVEEMSRKLIGIYEDDQYTNEHLKKH